MSPHGCLPMSFGSPWVLLCLWSEDLARWVHFVQMGHKRWCWKHFSPVCLFLLKYLCVLEDLGNFQIILWAKVNGERGEKDPSVCQTKETNKQKPWLSLFLTFPCCDPGRPLLLCAQHPGDESGGLADIIKCICSSIIPPKCDKCPLKRYEFTLLWP